MDPDVIHIDNELPLSPISPPNFIPLNDSTSTYNIDLANAMPAILPGDNTKFLLVGLLFEIVDINSGNMTYFWQVIDNIIGTNSVGFQPKIV